MPYIGNQPFGKTVRTITSETLTSVANTFYPTGGYTVGYVDVYLNGVRLTETADFTATDGSTVTLLFNPLISDTVDIVSYGTVEMANAVRREGDTLIGTLNTRDLVPTTNVTYDIGTSDKRYRDLYLSGNTIQLGNVSLSTNGEVFVVANTTGGVLPSELGNTTITGTLTANDTTIVGSANVTSSIVVGANVSLTTSGVSIGNSSVNTAITSSSITTEAVSVNGGMMFRNRIINGDMRIAQRTNGASTSAPVTRGSGFGIDRWSVWLANWSSGSATHQQSTDVPSDQGFVNSLLVTVTGASSSPDPSNGRFLIHQMIEGYNVADLRWGTANAKTITLSFWVKSSVTGNYGFTLSNNVGNRGYVVSYAINSANTWEKKTLTIPGDTSGTWTTDNTAGITLNFDLGVNGPTSDTVNTWLAGDYRGLTSGVDLIRTNGATFYLTGVQFEVGSVATPFERRPYGTELALCQRYYWSQWGGNSTNSGTGRRFGVGNVYGGGVGSYIPVFFPTPMRAAPTATFETATNYMMINANDSGNPSCSSLSLIAACTTQATINATVASGLVAGNCTALTGANSPIYPVIQYSAEL